MKKFKAYIDSEHSSPSAFATAIGKPRQTVLKWYHGKSRPDLVSAALIEKHSGGQVSFKDWI